MAQSNFGAGYMFGIGTGANPTPRLFGALQDVTMDDSFDMKPLHGQLQGALEHGRGKRKIELKASTGRFDLNLYNDLYLGLSVATGETLYSANETVVDTANTYTVANASTFKTDLGIFNTVTQKFLQRVASAPTTGQYSVVTTTGVYTFAAADSAVPFKVYYTYGSASTGIDIPVTNQLMGFSPIFQVVLVNSFRGRNIALTFPAVQTGKFGLPMKMDDWTYGSMDMVVQDDGAGNMYYVSQTG
jgi:hypothetical protein